MFLFTNAPVGNREAAAPARAGTADGAVVAAIRDGAQSTGVGFDYLLATAQRESSLNPTAKAGTSSATGLFQFIEQTWLGVMKTAGPRLGLSAQADAITARADGSYAVADPAARQAILDLRRDPTVSARMAGALTQRNREALVGALGREPTSGDLYAAHVLGARGAATLIGTAQASPARAAALDLPEAAGANRALFYDRADRPRGAAELYALLATATSGAPTPVATASAGEAEVPTAYASLEGGLRSLFQTDRRQGAISEGVARLWQGRTETARAAPTYFPRGDGPESESTAPAAPASPVAAGAGGTGPIVVPLPPRRPASLTAGADAATARTSARPGRDRGGDAPGTRNARAAPFTPAALTGAAAASATPMPAAAAPAAGSLFDPATYQLRNGS